MSYSLNSLEGVFIGDYIREYFRSYEGDTGSLDYIAHMITLSFRCPSRSGPRLLGARPGHVGGGS